MKNSIRIVSSLLTAGFLTLAAGPVHALTAADLAGVYQGTSTATFPNGQVVVATGTITLKPGGNVKGNFTVNGQTVASKAKYTFISENAIYETTAGGTAIAFVDLTGTTLTLNLLVRLDSGEVVREVTTGTLVKKL